MLLNKAVYLLKLFIGDCLMLLNKAVYRSLNKAVYRRLSNDFEYSGLSEDVQ